MALTWWRYDGPNHSCSQYLLIHRFLGGGGRAKVWKQGEARLGWQSKWSKTGGRESSVMSRNKCQQHTNLARTTQLRGVSVFSFQFSFPVSISFSFPAFPDAQKSWILLTNNCYHVQSCCVLASLLVHTLQLHHLSLSVSDSKLSNTVAVISSNLLSTIVCFSGLICMFAWESQRTERHYCRPFNNDTTISEHLLEYMENQFTNLSLRHINLPPCILTGLPVLAHGNKEILSFVIKTWQWSKKCSSFSTTACTVSIGEVAQHT